jgi:hypothetical protein
MAGAGVLLGVALNRVWEGRYGSHVTTIVPTAAEGFKTAYKLWPRMARETIGSFGYLNVTMHAPPYWTWGVLIVALVAAGLVLATPYRRFVLALFVLGVLVLPAAQHFYVGMGSGYGVQARHLLPMFVVLPIVAAEAIRRGGDPSPTVARFLPLVLVPAAAVQLIAWWTNARRGAVGIFGPRMFFRSPAWSPPLGWYPWLFLAVAGSALIGAAGVLAASRVSDQSAEN